MKTLKFMLAAATAIGLASASQAAGPYNGSTSFEDDTLGYLTNSTAFSTAYWTVPAGAEDADYTVVEGTPNAALRSAGAVSKFGSANTKVLQLEGGTDPLLRNIQSTGAAVNLKDGAVYVDTLVQFTVTPANDVVEAGGTDKLMVYFKEVTNSVGTVVGTNLTVRTALYQEDILQIADTIEEKEIVTSVGAPNIEPGTWYRLTVRASSVPLLYDNTRYLPVFTVTVGSYELDAGLDLANGSGNTKLFPSILGAVTTPTISSVGFAGSGSVDDLLFTTFDPAMTVLDFYLVLDDTVQGINGSVSYSTTADTGTLDGGTNTVYCDSAYPTVTVSYTLNDGFSAAWDTCPTGITVTAGAVYTLTVTQIPTGVDFTLTLATGVSSVSFTLGGDTYSATAIESPKTFSQLAAGTATLGAVTYADWYVAGNVKEGSTITVSSESTAATVDAVKATASEIITDSTTAADLGITNPKFTSDSPSQLSKLAAWAQGLSTPLTIAQVNAMTFTAGDLNSEAFLLNCANTPEAVATAKAAFKFLSITPGSVPEVYEPANGYNVEPVIYGGNAVDAINVTPATGSHKFYKATLTK